MRLKFCTGQGDQSGEGRGGDELPLKVGGSHSIF